MRMDGRLLMAEDHVKTARQNLSSLGAKVSLDDHTQMQREVREQMDKMSSSLKEQLEAMSSSLMENLSQKVSRSEHESLHASLNSWCSLVHEKVAKSDLDTLLQDRVTKSELKERLRELEAKIDRSEDLCQQSCKDVTSMLEERCHGAEGRLGALEEKAADLREVFDRQTVALVQVRHAMDDLQNQRWAGRYLGLDSVPATRGKPHRPASAPLTPRQRQSPYLKGPCIHPHAPPRERPGSARLRPTTASMYESVGSQHAYDYFGGAPTPSFDIQDLKT
jgi:hypothetical protein